MTSGSNGGADTFDYENAGLQRWPYIANLNDGPRDAELFEGWGKRLLCERPARPIWKGLTIAGTLNRVERRSRAGAHRAG